MTNTIKNLYRFTAVAAVLLFSGRDAFGAVDYTSVIDSLKSVELVDVRILDSCKATATIRIGFNNPGGAFEISNVNADLIIDGKTAFRVSSENVIAVKHKGYGAYVFDADINIPENSNRFLVLNILKHRYPPKMEVDCSAKLALRGGAGITLHKRISLDDKFKIGEYDAALIGKTFNVKRVGDFKIRTFDLLYIDEIGTGKFRTNIEITIVCPTIMGFSPEFGFEALLRLSNKEAINIRTVYDLDLKKGEKTYNILLDGELAEGFNPCALLGLLKNSGKETISFKVLEDGSSWFIPKKEFTIYSKE